MSKYLRNSNPLPFIPHNTLASAVISPLIKIHYGEDKIRNRMSYGFWKSIAQAVNNKGFSSEEKVRAMHMILNDRMMFGTEKQAGFDAESAEQAILDVI